MQTSELRFLTKRRWPRSEAGAWPLYQVVDSTDHDDHDQYSVLKCGSTALLRLFALMLGLHLYMCYNLSINQIRHVYTI